MHDLVTLTAASATRARLRLASTSPTGNKLSKLSVVNFSYSGHARGIHYMIICRIQLTHTVLSVYSTSTQKCQIVPPAGKRNQPRQLRSLSQFSFPSPHVGTKFTTSCHSNNCYDPLNFTITVSQWHLAAQLDVSSYQPI